MNKVLSISIAAYNVEQYIEKNLNSLLLKDKDVFNKLEVLVINDGSSDNTFDLASKYQKKYPNVFKVIDKKNGGYGSTINCSLKYATGKYFKLVDGDDWCDTDGLSNLICFLDKCDSDIVVSKYCLVSEVDGARKVIDGGLKFSSNTIKIEQLGKIEALQMHFLSIKTSLLKQNKIKITEKCYYTDVEYILRPIPYVNTVSFCNELVYMYRIGRDGQSVSIKSWQKNIDMALKVTFILIDFYLDVCSKKDVSNYKKDYIYRRVLGTSASKYKIFLSFTPSKKIKKDLIQYDKNLKTTSIKIYNDCMKLRLVKLLRLSDFKLYYLLSFLYRIHLKFTNQI